MSCTNCSFLSYVDHLWVCNYPTDKHTNYIRSPKHTPKWCPKDPIEYYI